MISGENILDENLTKRINIAKFYLACREGNKDLVENLVNSGLVEVNVTNEYGDTGLIWAALKGHDTVVAFLIQSGVDVNKQDNYGNTALIYACGKGYKNVIRLLIDSGADANIRNNRNETAIAKACSYNQKNIVYFLLRNVPYIELNNVKLLIWACGNGYIKIVKELLRMGVDKNEVYYDSDIPLLMTHSGRIPKTVRLSLENTNDFVSINKWIPVIQDTPLLMACLGGYTDIVELLLAHNVNINIQNKNNNTPLLMACIGGYKKIVRLLLEKGANPNVRNLNGWVPLIYASYSGRYSIVELLLRYGANVDDIDSSGNTALMFACDKSNEDLVKLLLTYNADVNMVDEEGDTALIRACMENNENIVKIILKHGAYVNVRNVVRQTALMWAADVGNISILESLINHGAKIDICDIKGDTAFMWACSAENFDAAKFLLKRHASINDLAKKNTNGKTFLMRLCETCKSIDFLRWLIREYYNENKEQLKTLINEADNMGITALMYACNEDFFALAEMLLLNGANVNAKDLDGNTALHIACRKEGSLNIITLLLDYGINIDIKNLNGNTPIHMACGNNLIDKTNFLINCGADLKKVDKQGDNSLHIACLYQSIDVITILVKEKIDVNAKNNIGKTPLIMACDRENENIAKILIKTGGNVNSIDKNGNTALNIACSKNNISMGTLLILNFANLYSLLKIEKEQRESYIDILNQTSNLKIKIRIALYKKDLNKLREYLNKYFSSLNIEKKEGETDIHYTYRVTSSNLTKIDDLKEFIYRLNSSEEIKKLNEINIKIRNTNDKLKKNPLMNIKDMRYELDLNEKLIREVSLFKDIIREVSTKNIVNSVLCIKKDLKKQNSIEKKSNIIPREEFGYAAHMDIT